MKYRVVTPLARSDPQEGTQCFTTDDIIEIADKAEAARMIEANIIVPISPERDASRKGEREIRLETADLKPVGVETTGRKPARVEIPKIAKTGKKRG